MKSVLPFFSIALLVLTGNHWDQFAEWVRYSGGGKEFLSFLAKELIPLIESEYRTDPDQRGLFGYSLGGTFTTYSLLYKPGLFRNYFIGDPMLSWDDWAIFDFDQTDKLAGTSDTLNVYLSWCDMEPGDDSNIPSIKLLKKKGNPNIRYKSEVLEDETHLSGIGLAYSRAFRRLYGF